MTEGEKITFKIKNMTAEQKTKLAAYADGYAAVFDYAYGIAVMLEASGKAADAKSVWHYAGCALATFPCVAGIPDDVRRCALYDALRYRSCKWLAKPLDGKDLEMSRGKGSVALDPTLTKANFDGLGEINVWMIDWTDAKAKTARERPVVGMRMRLVPGTGIMMTLTFALA